jgi:hypothetical protein
MKSPIWSGGRLVHSRPPRCGFELGKIVIEGTPAKAGEKQQGELAGYTEGSFLFFTI